MQMAKRFALLLLLFLGNLYASDDFIELKGNMFIACADSFPAYDTAIISKIAVSLGMERMETIHPGFKIGFRTKRLRWFLGYSEAKVDRHYLHPDLAALNDACPLNDSLYLDGFHLFVPNGKRVRNNLFAFILSAYEQELYPSIKTAEGNFLTLPEKSEKAVMHYTWMSPGYAMNYLYACNPFSTLSPALQYAYYVMDACGLALAIGAPFFAKSTRDKVLQAGLGLVFLAEIRLLAGFELRREVQRYTSIRNSPYRVPNTVIFKGCN